MNIYLVDVFLLDGGHDGFYTEMMEAPGIPGVFGGLMPGWSIH